MFHSRHSVELPSPQEEAVAEELPVSPGKLTPAEAQAVLKEIMKLSSVIASAQARVIELVMTHGDWLTGGDALPTWLAWAGGMKPATAHKHLRLGGYLSELPKIKESFAKGEISFDKAETIARVASTETEETLLMWAQNGTCEQMSTITGAYRKAKVYAEGAAAAQRDRRVSFHYDDQGIFRLRAQMPAEQGALVAQALTAAEEQLYEQQRTFQGHDLDEVEQRLQSPNEYGGRGARRADGLVAMAETFLAHGLSDGEVSDRYHVLVHLDEAALAGDPDGAAEIEDAAGITPEAARRIACDCNIQALLTGKGTELKLGRNRRTVSPGLKKALRARDRHCVFPGCTNTRRLHGHHVKHWLDHGETEPENLTLLCPRHHRLLHEGRYSMTFDGLTARFFRPDGSEVERVPRAPNVAEVEEAELWMAAGVDFDTWATHIDPYSLADAVEYLCLTDPAYREIEEKRALARAGALTGAAPEHLTNTAAKSK
jgi:hypothetical protein